MEHPFPAPGVEMITQEYLAASRELRSRTDLTVAQRERLKDDLADEHQLRCAQEWKSVLAQMREDQEAGSRSLSESVPLSRRARERRPSPPVDPEDDEADERESVEIRHERAWEQFLGAERRELEMRQEGHLARMLGDPLAGESPEDLERLAQGDRLRALEGLVTLKSEGGRSVYKPLSELTPEDRTMRLRAEGDRVAWIVGRGKKRPSSSP